jgi:hypothetical protein
LPYINLDHISMDHMARFRKASAISKKDLLGLEAENWSSLCSLYMMFGGLVLLARLVLIKERGVD